MTTQNSSSSQGSRLVRTPYIVGGVIGLLLIAILGVVGIVVVARYYSAELDVIRDLVIISLAMLSCLFGITLIILVVMLIRLINTVEFEIRPILQQTNQLVGTAKETTQFVSTNIIEPTVKAKGYVAGAQAGMKAFFGDPKQNLPK